MDGKWLQRRGHVWLCVQEVPRELRALLGKRRLVKSLKTRDHAEALKRRHAVLDHFARVLDRARQQAGAGAVMAEAMDWRETFIAFKRGNYSGFSLGADYGADHDTAAAKEFVARGVLAERADEIEGRHGKALAEQFHGIATGTATPLLTYIDAWLAEGGKRGKLSSRTASQYEADMKRFAAWCAAAGIPATIEAITRKVVGQFVAEEITAKDVHWATGNRILSAPSSYWKWLIKRGHAEASPWQGASLSKGRGEKRRRAMTDAELAALLAAAEDQEMRDLITFAALTGARLGEITALQARDCADGWFMLRGEEEGARKTQAATRRIPIHSMLEPIVARRIEGRKPADRLFKVNAAAASKRLGRLRQAAGVHEGADDRRQSAVTAHSLRHWATTKMRNAGHDRLIVDLLTGHAPQGETDGRYFGKADDALLVRAIESLALPTAQTSRRPCAPSPARSTVKLIEAADGHPAAETVTDM